MENNYNGGCTRSQSIGVSRIVHDPSEHHAIGRDPSENRSQSISGVSTCFFAKPYVGFLRLQLWRLWWLWRGRLLMVLDVVAQRCCAVVLRCGVALWCCAGRVLLPWDHDSRPQLLWLPLCRDFLSLPQLLWLLQLQHAGFPASFHGCPARYHQRRGCLRWSLSCSVGVTLLRLPSAEFRRRTSPCRDCGGPGWDEQLDSNRAPT